MFGRLVASIFLIGIGIASPWLVKDWLEWRSNEGGKSVIYEKLTSFPAKLKEKWDGPENLIAANDASEKRNGSSAESPGEVSLPFASKTMRMLQGLLPADEVAEAGFPSIPIQLGQGYSSPIPGSSLDPETMVAELEALDLRMGDPVYLRLFKEENELEVWMQAAGNAHYTLFKVYQIKGWSGRLGPKLREGDRQTPEGFYYAGASRMIPETRHHLGIDVGYPNEFDRYHGRTGSELMIHGGTSDAGAFVLSRDDMEEVYALSEASLKAGRRLFRINIFPFRMTDRRMESEWEEQPDWIDFWVNLKEGYDFFENVNFPPEVAVGGGKYVFRFP